MLCKQTKKAFQPGTFIPFPARLAAIIHLCLAFTLFLWITSKPFMGDLFAIKSEKVLSQAILEKTELYKQLPVTEQSLIKKHDATLNQMLQLPFMEKSLSAIKLLFMQTPPLEQAWLLFSIMIPILLLLKIEGAIQICWLLPFITLLYSIDNQLNAPIHLGHPDKFIFPTEKFIHEQYLHNPLDPSNTQQQMIVLKKGWEQYLIAEWAKEIPSNKLEEHKRQVEKGEFAFNVSRLKQRNLKNVLAIDVSAKRQPLYLLGLYLFWNIFFALLARNTQIRHTQTT